ncbi:MAG: class I adenylate-forming enzyme family protein [Alphaproteobacteria bacterium]|nr:class I adenylate-forming enzyme family protein [Alphaproteobacteria bacterium]
MATAFDLNLGGLIDPEGDLSAIAFIDLAGMEPGGEGKAHTRGQIDALANAVARGLTRRGLVRGDAVAILAENSVDYLGAYMGIMRAGMVAVPINYRQTARTVGHIVEDSETRLIFADQGRWHLCPDGVPVIDMSDAGENGFGGLLDPGSFRIVAPAPRETAMILYTSGSTGMPKGVMLSHEGQLFALSRWACDATELARHQLLVAAPQYHMNALFISKLALTYSAGVVLLPRFDVEAYIQAIPRHRITWLTSVPTMLALVVREQALLKATDLSTIERVSMGSAPLTESLFDEVQSWFPGALVSNLYGTTEHGPSAFGPHPDGMARPKLSLGYAATGMELRLVGGSDENTGVLEARSVSNLTGYKNLPVKTAEVIRDGWYHTNDVMRRDENGFYFIIGREDDMFVCNGENVFPGDVERMLETHQDIDQASVISIEDPVRGHVPIAFIVRARDADLDEAEVQAFSRAEGPAYQFPRRVVFLDTLPLAGTNKIDRAALEQRARTLT